MIKPKRETSRIERMLAAILCGVSLGMPLAFLGVTIYKDLDTGSGPALRQTLLITRVNWRPLKIKNLKKPFKIKLAKKLKVERRDTNLIVVDTFKRVGNTSADRIPVVRRATHGLQPRDPFGTEIQSRIERGEED